MEEMVKEAALKLVDKARYYKAEVDFYDHLTDLVMGYWQFENNQTSKVLDILVKMKLFKKA